jgi:hypothetical protein
LGWILPILVEKIARDVDNRDILAFTVNHWDYIATLYDMIGRRSILESLKNTKCID